MKLILFDFDGTIAKTSSLHKEAWIRTLNFIGSRKDFETFLPYIPNDKERFDSVSKISKSLESEPYVIDFFRLNFGIIGMSKVVRKLFDLKESFTIAVISEMTPEQLSKLLSENIQSTLSILIKRNYKLGIISSSRQSTVVSFLLKTRLIDYFDTICGEDDMYDGDKLKDKPDQYIMTKLDTGIGEPFLYIGDSPVDQKFSENINVRYIHHKYSLNFESIIDQL